MSLVEDVHDASTSVPAKRPREDVDEGLLPAKRLKRPAQFLPGKRPRMDCIEQPVGVKRARYAWAGQLVPYPFAQWDLGEASQMLRQKYEGFFHSFIRKPQNDFDYQSVRLNDAIWSPKSEKVAMVELKTRRHRESSIHRTTQRGPELILVEDAHVNRPDEPRAGSTSTPMTIRRGDRFKMPSPYIAALWSGEWVTSNLPRDPRTPVGSGWAWAENVETHGKARPAVKTTAGRKPRKSKWAEKKTSSKTNAVKQAPSSLTLVKGRRRGKGKGKREEKETGPPKRRPRSLRLFSFAAYTEKEDEEDAAEAERDAATETTAEVWGRCELHTCRKARMVAIRKAPTI
ncbi:hypothetical protein B0H14DRAFT_3756983 [Mycena olivaceomarginata]|nr:hypothetical protein B0H14DRAFT_3756983 [Mycena olivaceomarginata]